MEGATKRGKKKVRTEGLGEKHKKKDCLKMKRKKASTEEKAITLRMAGKNGG